MGKKRHTTVFGCGFEMATKPRQWWMLLILAAFFPGCLFLGGDLIDDTICTEIGCSDRLEIVFERKDGERLPAGDYELSFTPCDDVTLDIACTLTKGLDLVCKGDKEDVEFELKKSALEMVAVFDFAPKTIDVEVTYDNQPVAMETLNPNYSVVTPNGPDCDPTCFQSTVIVNLNGFF